MIGKKLLAGFITAALGLSAVGILSANAVTTEENVSYTIEDIKNLQDFLLVRDTPDLTGMDYDLNGDGIWNVFDLCLMKRQYMQQQETSKILVAYFSTPEITDAATTASRVTVDGQTYGTTEYMAAVIHENTNSDIFKIELVEPYGSNVPDRALNEQQNGILPELSSHIENLEQYDVIFVGYPTWWYDMPQVMYSFFDEYDFSGKTIIPFNSHGGSGFSGSIEEIAEFEPNAIVRTDGLTISRGSVATSEDTIVNWLDEIGMKNS